jgi:hypothetical protein
MEKIYIMYGHLHQQIIKMEQPLSHGMIRLNIINLKSQGLVQKQAILLK